jgi:hypothetical protein
MVMNKRSPAFAGGSVVGASGSVFTAGSSALASACGGISDGQRNARSMRSCDPAWRCTLVRIAAGGTLKSTSATVTGIAGASAAIGAVGQVGHST